DYPTWRREWETRMASVLGFPVHPHQGPDREFVDWWYELTRRFLSPEGLQGDPRGGEVEEVVTTKGTQVPPHRTQVPDVPDRRCADRRRRRRHKGRGKVGAGVGRGDGFGVPDPMGGVGDDVFGGGYVPLNDDLLGDAAMWAQDDDEASGSHQAVDPPQFHVDLNKPATGLHDVYYSLGGTPLLHFMAQVHRIHRQLSHSRPCRSPHPRSHNQQCRSQYRMRTMLRLFVVPVESHARRVLHHSFLTLNMNCQL
ncbi:hypothetical protein PIB30_095197, partial [Stylosanthes scabra]|nr:hypothetical protein [Stylosanthes scabra]